MATVNLKTTVTLVDMFKTLDPNGDMAQIVNTTTEAVDLLKDAQWMRANDGQTHMTTRVASLPTIYEKVLGEGVASSAGSHTQIVEDTMKQESWLEIEDALLQQHPSPEAYVRAQIALHVQQHMETMTDILVYGNRSTNYKRINGLATRMNALQSDKAQGKVVSCAVSGDADSDKTSLWLLKWGEDGIFLTYPGDLPNGGIDVQDFGYETKRDSTGKMIRVAVQRIRTGFGLVIRDPRAIVRLCNIDTSSMTSANWITYVEDKLVEALNDMPNSGAGTVLYGNVWSKTKFDIRAKDKGNVWYDGADPWGKRVTKFLDTPIRNVDAILKTEAAVS